MPGVGRAIVASAALGGGLSAALDYLAAAALNDAGLDVIGRVIASGWLGRSAMQGGAGVVALGAASHFAILIVAAGAFAAAASRAPVLHSRWWLFGPLFGAAIFAVMNYLVVPLSASFVRAPTRQAFVEQFLLHAAMIGPVIAGVSHLVLSRAARRTAA